MRTNPHPDFESDTSNMEVTAGFDLKVIDQ